MEWRFEDCRAVLVCAVRTYNGKMHELSIAESMVELAVCELEREGPVRVQVVRMRVGALSGVVKEALLFAFDSAAAGTALAGAELEIEEVPVAIFCPRCEAERELKDIAPLACPACGEPGRQVVRGRELELVSLEVSDGPENS